jgi:hypothetical protein
MVNAIRLLDYRAVDETNVALLIRIYDNSATPTFKSQEVWLNSPWTATLAQIRARCVTILAGCTTLNGVLDREYTL